VNRRDLLSRIWAVTLGLFIAPKGEAAPAQRNGRVALIDCVSKAGLVIKMINSCGLTIDETYIFPSPDRGVVKMDVPAETTIVSLSAMGPDVPFKVWSVTISGTKA